MTNTRTYDGDSKLGDAIAVLYGCSPRSNNKISELTKQAKAALGIGKSKRLNADVNRSIWQWHYDRLQALETFQQVECVNIVSQPEPDSLVETFSQTAQGGIVEILSQPDDSEGVELFSQVRIAFYTINHDVRTRQVIALEGYLVNALMLATGITKQAVPKWVQQAVDGWCAFDPALPITKQVKFLLIRELTTHIKK